MKDHIENAEEKDQILMIIEDEEDKDQILIIEDKEEKNNQILMMIGDKEEKNLLLKENRNKESPLHQIVKVAKKIMIEKVKVNLKRDRKVVVLKVLIVQQL